MAAASAGATQAGFLSETICSTASKLQQQQPSQQSAAPLETYEHELLSSSRPHQTIANEHDIILVQASTVPIQQQKQQTRDQTKISPTLVPYQSNQKSFLQSLPTTQRIQLVQRTADVNFINGYGSNTNDSDSTNSNDLVKLSTVQDINVEPNVAPGWQRQLSDGEIIYISPSGASLQKIAQVKDYLLSPGTCKCGLPCPLRPEQFFEFNPQIPSLSTQAQAKSEESGACISSCLHQARFLEQNNLWIKSDTKRKDSINDEYSSNSLPAIFSETTPTTATATASITIHAALGNNNKLQTNFIKDVRTQQNSTTSPNPENLFLDQTDSDENKVANIAVSRTPPWQKNSILNQQQSMVIQSNSSNLTNNVNCRVPPLPQQHLIQTKPQPPWQEETHKRRNITKKRPNFKEDPNGYLAHQTAILHNSILNVHSPELQDTSTSNHHPLQIAYKSNVSRADNTEINNQNTQIKVEETEQIGGQPHLSVMQQQQQNQNNSHKQQQPHYVIGPNGQPVRIIQNPHQIVYANSTFQPSQASQLKLATESHQSGNDLRLTQQIVSASAQNMMNSQIVHLPQSQQFSSHQHHQIVTSHHSVNNNLSTTIQTKQTTKLVHFDQEQQTKPSDNQTIGLPICVSNLPNEHTTCDINQIREQRQLQRHTPQMQNYLIKQNEPRSYSNATKFALNQKQNHLSATPTSQESPVSSSTNFKNVSFADRSSPDDKGPAQVGAISTSNESPPIASPSLTDMGEVLISTDPTLCSSKYQIGSGIYDVGQTRARNTITSVLAGKTMTSTTTTTSQTNLANKKIRFRGRSADNHIHIQSNQLIKPANATSMLHSAPKHSNINLNLNTSVGQNLDIPTSTNVSALQLQQLCNSEASSSQIIMTSSGQILLMPSQDNKSPNQMILSNPNNNTLVMNNTSSQNMVINAHSPHLINSELIRGINENHTQTNIIQNTNNSVVIQGTNMVPGSPTLLQSSNSVITANSGNVLTANRSNFIVGSPNSMQSMILNNGNVLQQTNQNLSGNILTTANATKVISNPGNLLSSPNVIGANNQLINGNTTGNLLSPNSGMVGQQTVVLNQLSSGNYVLQPQTITTVDGQVLNVINSDGTNHHFMQQNQQRIIVSPDSKRRTIKRKSNSVSPSTPPNHSPLPSPTIQHHQHQHHHHHQQQQQTATQQSTMLQITPQYHHQSQSFQISPGGTGITLVQNKPSMHGTAPQQQILLQNGQTILQPINLIGQQLLVPAGLMMAPETTLLQIQNVGPCSSLIGPQGMVIRTPNSQNKSFLSPNSGNQQFIVSGNGQISPIGQMYGTSMGLVVPQSNNGPTFVQQQNTTTVVQGQSTMMNSTNTISDTELRVDNPQSVSTQTAQPTVNTVTASPPDTTTHSPRSPERPPSQRSVSSDINMVQYVSSSEPDTVVSPVTIDGAQSPSNLDYESNSGGSYHQNIFKPTEAKIRRIQPPGKYNVRQMGSTHRNNYKMTPDSHESSPTQTATTSAIFCVGEVIWGPARGHPAWPGKIVSAPDGLATPSDSTWVRWFGGRPNIELVTIGSLKSLTEGFEAHHKAQKDTRKSRKLNSQLEQAIQEAMSELDSATAPKTPPTKVAKAKTTRTTIKQRSKPIKIAPAPPTSANVRRLHF